MAVAAQKKSFSLFNPPRSARSAHSEIRPQHLDRLRLSARMQRSEEVRSVEWNEHALIYSVGDAGRQAASFRVGKGGGVRACTFVSLARRVA